MKYIFGLFLTIFFFSFSVSSCTKTEIKTDTVTVTKTDTVAPPRTIVGFWVGTYQVSGSTTSYYVSFDLRPDGVFLYKGSGSDGNTYYAQGTYTLTGTNFTYSFTTLNGGQAGAVQTATGTYSPASGIISGVWQNPGYINGTFSVTESE